MACLIFCFWGLFLAFAPKDTGVTGLSCCWADRFLPAYLAPVLAFFQKWRLFWPKLVYSCFTRTHAVFGILSPQKPRYTAPHRPKRADKMTRSSLILSCPAHAAQNSKCGRRLISAREFESLHLRQRGARTQDCPCPLLFIEREGGIYGTNHQRGST